MASGGTVRLVGIVVADLEVVVENLLLVVAAVAFAVSSVESPVPAYASVKCGYFRHQCICDIRGIFVVSLTIFRMCAPPDAPRQGMCTPLTTL